MKLGIRGGMSTQQINNSILVAVPYYGSLSLPPLGLSRLFFVAEVDAASSKVGLMEIQVWDPKKEPNLSVWMRKQGFSGVICSDSCSHYQVALNAENIWLMGKQEGEAAEVVERWATGALDESGSCHLGRQLNSWCGPQYGNAAIAV
jgi:predicted Fe-Mo cluster-binding NifX family protein